MEKKEEILNNIVATQSLSKNLQDHLQELLRKDVITKDDVTEIKQKVDMINKMLYDINDFIR